MFSLLAQVQASTSIFDNDVVKEILLLLGAGGFGWLVTAIRDVRKNVTSEVRMQMLSDDAESEERKIPQPLTVRAHIDFTPLRDHQELKSEFEKLRDQRRTDVSGLHTKIEQGLRKTSDDIAMTAGEIGKLQVSQEMQTRELHAIRLEQSEVSKRIDAMPARVVQNLKDTKGLL